MKPKQSQIKTATAKIQPKTNEEKKTTRSITYMIKN